MKFETKVVLAVIFILVFAAIQATSIYFQKQRFEEMTSTQTIQLNKHLETNQFLLSTLDWSTIRQKKILFMRDEIIGEWKRCGIKKLNYEKAFTIAETNMNESEKYLHIDPMFLLAVQWQESRFVDTVKSHMGACGLMQVMPATGRLICGFFHMSYCDSILWRIDINIMLGTKLIDVLYSEYQNLELVLAGYNGGPYQAFYFKTKDKRLEKETKNFVPSILKQYGGYTEKLKTYKINYKLLPPKG